MCIRDSALIVMAKFFLPLFLEKKIYTMPQFLEQRFDKRVSLVLSFFWLIVYIFINLTSVLWLGSLAINALTGLDLFYGLVLLAIFSLAYSLSGGLKAVAMTDAVQVVLLIFGGLAVSFIALNIISESNGVIGKATLSWNPSDGIMYYVTWSEGFRPGLLNRPVGRTNADGSYTVKPEVGSDEITNYEFGWKSVSNDGQLRFNGSLFRVDISGLQTSIFDPSIANLFFSDNAADGTIRGLEGDFLSLIHI